MKVIFYFKPRPFALFFFSWRIQNSRSTRECLNENTFSFLKRCRLIVAIFFIITTCLLLLDTISKKTYNIDIFVIYQLSILFSLFSPFFYITPRNQKKGALTKILDTSTKILKTIFYLV